MTTLRAWIEQAGVDSWAVLSAPFKPPPGWTLNPTPLPGDYRFRSPDGLLVTPLMLRDAQGQEWIHLSVSRQKMPPTVEDLQDATWLFGKPKSSVWLPMEERNRDGPADSRRFRVSVWIRCDGLGIAFADGEIDSAWIRQVARPPAPPPQPVVLYDAYNHPMQPGMQPVYGQGVYGPQAQAGYALQPQVSYAPQSSALGYPQPQQQPVMTSVPYAAAPMLGPPQGYTTPAIARAQEQLAQAQAQAALEAQAAAQGLIDQAQAQAAQERIAQAQSQLEQAQASFVRLAQERAARMSPPTTQMTQVVAQAPQVVVQAQPLPVSASPQLAPVVYQSAQTPPLTGPVLAQAQMAPTQAAPPFQAVSVTSEARGLTGDRTWVPGMPALAPVVPQVQGNGHPVGVTTPPVGGEQDVEALLSALMSPSN